MHCRVIPNSFTPLNPACIDQFHCYAIIVLICWHMMVPSAKSVKCPLLRYPVTATSELTKGALNSFSVDFCTVVGFS